MLNTTPRKFLRGKLRCDSALSAAGARATPGAVSSSSAPGHVCTSAMVSRCRQHMAHQHSGDSDILGELQWTTAP